MLHGDVQLHATRVPWSFKEANITPLLKKSDLDSADPKSYRPIANLSVLSKLREGLVARQFLDYLNAEVSGQNATGQNATNNGICYYFLQNFCKILFKIQNTNTVFFYRSKSETV